VEGPQARVRRRSPGWGLGPASMRRRRTRTCGRDQWTCRRASRKIRAALASRARPCVQGTLTESHPPLHHEEVSERVGAERRSLSHRGLESQRPFAPRRTHVRPGLTGLLPVKPRAIHDDRILFQRSVGRSRSEGPFGLFFLIPNNPKYRRALSRQRPICVMSSFFFGHRRVTPHRRSAWSLALRQSSTLLQFAARGRPVPAPSLCARHRSRPGGGPAAYRAGRRSPAVGIARGTGRWLVGPMAPAARRPSVPHPDGRAGGSCIDPVHAAAYRIEPGAPGPGPRRPASGRVSWVTGWRGSTALRFRPSGWERMK